MTGTVVIIQARMGSTRLPGKVMNRLGDDTVLGHVIRGTQAAQEVDRVIVATTTAAQDAVIEREAMRCGAAVYRGSEHDVLSRYAEAAAKDGADTIVRVTSDCPFMDPEVIDGVIRLYRDSVADYASNVVERTFPRGLDVEVFSSAILQQAHRSAISEFEREHVTPYIYRNPEMFRLVHFKGLSDYSHHRWTLDTPEDWEFIQTVSERIDSHEKPFAWTDILQFLEVHPEIILINAHIEQKKV